MVAIKTEQPASSSSSAVHVKRESEAPNEYYDRQQAEEIAAAAAAALSGVVLLKPTGTTNELIPIESNDSNTGSGSGTTGGGDGMMQNTPLTKSKPPLPLPAGWVLRASRSQPNYYYYYNQETGASHWEPPFLLPNATTTEMATTKLESINESTVSNFHSKTDPMDDVKPKVENRDETDAATHDAADGRHKKKQRRSSTDSASSHTAAGSNSSSRSSSSKGGPTKVRVLHILRKHKDSRKPASWRMPNGGAVTVTKDEARAELQSLLELLQETASDPDELRATFEELARTESDCSSYKRGGDLGFFERKKMQQAFEDAAFGMEIGELSHDIVDTASGLHILLRIG